MDDGKYRPTDFDEMASFLFEEQKHTKGRSFGVVISIQFLKRVNSDLSVLT